MPKAPMFRPLAELSAVHGARAITMIPKVLAGRIVHGMPVDTIVEFDLHRQPFATWPGYAATHQIAPFFRFVNSAHGGGAFFQDKVLSAERCHALGIPMLPIAAVAARALPTACVFAEAATVEAIADFIAGAEMPGDAFVKPVGGMGGDGAFAARRDGDGWRVAGKRISDAELALQIAATGDEKGALVQPLVSMPPALSPVGGQFGLATLRVQTALTKTGPLVVYMVQKILGGALAIDNFSGGRKGNLIAAVDPDTGELGCAYGRDPGRTHIFRSYGAHPATGERIAGYRLSAIHEVVAVALRVAASFPETPLVGCDIAITEDGVKLVEINNSPDQLLAQIAYRRSAADLFRSIVPELRLTPEEIEAVKAKFASCINKRQRTVDYE